ncbi:MAG: hypothetical protein J6Y01_06195, partial [Spirochaetales bacterium]|nr:hypothetical protein [Spirochaetales bacterium]
MKSNRLIKSILNIVSALLLVLGVSCSNSNILNTVTVENTTISNSDKAEVIISFMNDVSRSWNVASYEVTATKGTGAPISATGSTSVKMELSAGDWSFIASGKDENGILIYRGRFETTISSQNEEIQIMMIKKSGSIIYDVSAFAASAGSAKAEVVASRATFDDVTVSLNNFNEKAVFQGLAVGKWTFKIYKVISDNKELVGDESCDIVADAVIKQVSSGNPVPTTTSTTTTTTT